MHYHLSATNPDCKVPGATNAIIAAAARIGMEAGLKRLHLGGGRTASKDDALLKFKESMATDRHHFQIGKRVPKSRRTLSFAAFGEKNTHRFLVPLWAIDFFATKRTLQYQVRSHKSMKLPLERIPNPARSRFVTPGRLLIGIAEHRSRR